MYIHWIYGKYKICNSEPDTPRPLWVKRETCGNFHGGGGVGASVAGPVASESW